MNSKVEIIVEFNKLLKHVSKTKKRGLLKLVLLTIATTVVEMVSVGSLIPFIGVIANPQHISQNEYYQLANKYFNLNEGRQLLFFAGIFGIASLLAGCMRLRLLKKSIGISFDIGADLSSEIYKKYLFDDYSMHVNRNSSNIVSAITSKINTIIYSILNPLLMGIASLFILVVFSVALLMVNVEIVGASMLTFALLYLAIGKVTKSKLNKNSVLVSLKSGETTRILQEGTAAIRDIIIDGSQNVFLDKYKKADVELRTAQASNMYTGSTPKIIVETLGLIFVAIISVTIANIPEFNDKVVVILGVLGVCIQKMLPLAQQIYSSWSTINGSVGSLVDCNTLLAENTISQKKLNCLPIDRFDSLEFRNVSFGYSKSKKPLISGTNICIKRGDRIGIVGISGSGKSTLMDLMLGLLEPTAGEILLNSQMCELHNNRNWQDKISHVPQHIFISDSTIKENIAFGVPLNEIDSSKVKNAAMHANLQSVIEAMPEGYETNVGERGLKLSGGQRQRLAIARALYKEAEVLFLDEATSALDNQTEAEIMKMIIELPKEITIIKIAHRTTTLEMCNKVYDISLSGVA